MNIENNTSDTNKPAKSTTRTRKLLRSLAWLVIIGFFFLNFSAFMQAWRMTHYADGGVKTPKPEALSALQKIKILFTGITLPKPRNDSTPADHAMQFTNVTFTAEDGVKLASWLIPGDPDKGIILMFHGYGSCKSRILPEALALHELGWNILMTDFRGSGDSDGYVTTIGLEEAKDVAKAFAWASSAYPDRTKILFGTSMGSAAILRAIHQGIAKPDGIIMECPYDKLLTTVKHRFEAMNAPSFPAAQLLVFWGGVQNGFNGFSLNPVDYAGASTCPALIMHGSSDSRVKRQEILSICGHLGGTKVLHEFHGPGHESYCTASPEEYRAVLKLWLKTHKEKQ